MARDASGTWTRGITPPVNGDVANADTYNTDIVDIGNEITASLEASGKKVWTGTQNANGYGIKSLLNTKVHTTAGGTTAYTVTTGASLSSIATMPLLFVKMNATNTGASTLNVDGIGATAIKKNGATALASGDLVVDYVYALLYDGTNWQLLGSIGAGAQPLDATLTALAALAYTSGTLHLTLTASDVFTLMADTALVHTTGAENIAGAKVFTDTPLSLTKSANASTKAVVTNTNAGASAQAELDLTTDFGTLSIIQNSTAAAFSGWCVVSAPGVLSLASAANMFLQGAGVTSFTLSATGPALAAGTTTVIPLKFTAGTNLTTATAGACEFDGSVFYKTAVASSRQVVTTSQFVTVQGSAVSLSNSSTSPQNIFAAANDVLSLAASTTYMFEGIFWVQTGTTSHTTALGFVASSAFTSIKYFAQLWSTTSGTISTTAPSVLDVTASTATVLNAASTAPLTTIRVRGTVRTNAASTITPQITFSAGPTGTCQTNVDSFFRIWPIGSNTVAAVGNWA